MPAPAPSDLDDEIQPRRPIINITYSTETAKKHAVPVYRVKVFDTSHGLKWKPITGKAADFLRVFTWYHETLGRHSDQGRNIIAFRTYHDEIRLHMVLYTAANRYTIEGFMRSKDIDVEKDDIGSHLQCTVRSRIQPEGEDATTRRIMLSEGEYTRETWDKIVGDMFGYEVMDRTTSRDCIWGLFPDGDDDNPESLRDARKLGVIKQIVNESKDGGSAEILEEPMRVRNL